MRILGVEGTAWAASAAVFDTEDDSVFIETDAYQPESGGIHPREAAEHMSEAIPSVIETALDRCEGRVDAVAFSRGPGLGPCLRIAGTAARSLAQTLDVPLVGVNHMVAHLEIGRHQSAFESPVCLNASGANAHVLGFHDGRYRVLGETMDTGVGNALDKFTRHVGWSHPGGPKVEAAAAEGEYVDLPYVVKGMDFSFSGIMSAAKDAYDEGTPVEDVCFSLQENVFAMLTEVAERALSLTGRDELVLGGGVGQNERLREMLAEMCDQRGAEFHAPEPRFLRDNAGMIAVLGARMVEAGDTLAVEDSAVASDFRPDQVEVTWRARDAERPSDRVSSAERRSASSRTGDARETTAKPSPSPRDDGEAREQTRRSAPRNERTGSEATREQTTEGRGDETEVLGAEATVEVGANRVIKRRRPKAYRHPALDDRLRRDRTVLEARLTSEARRHGVPTPVVFDVDTENGCLVFERVGTSDLRDALSPDRVRDVARHLATVHGAGFVHGDPTARNARVGPDRTYLIDFGLGYYTDAVEDYAMDLHVLDRSLAGTADDHAALRSAFEEAYASVGDDAVLSQLREIEGRGRYQ